MATSPDQPADGLTTVVLRSKTTNAPLAARYREQNENWYLHGYFS